MRARAFATSHSDIARGNTTLRALNSGTCDNLKVSDTRRFAEARTDRVRTRIYRKEIVIVPNVE